MNHASQRNQPIAALTIGAELFAEALEEQGVPVVRVAWRPPAGNIPALAKLLASQEVEQANQIAVERVLAAHPRIIDVQPAREAMPDALVGRALVHAGPPITWGRVCGPMPGASIGACLYEGWAQNDERASQLG